MLVYGGVWGGVIGHIDYNVSIKVGLWLNLGRDSGELFSIFEAEEPFGEYSVYSGVQFIVGGVDIVFADVEYEHDFYEDDG